MTGTRWTFSHLSFVLALFFALESFLPARAVEPKVEGTAPAQPAAPFEAVIVQPDVVDERNLLAWKNEGFAGIVLALDESFQAPVYERAAKQIAGHSLPLYYWIEVGRNPLLAHEHPQWMASVGMHDDWRARFPDARQPNEGEVVKAWPWIPIAYRDAFDAHLARIARLLQRVPAGYRGILVNDLQGGPSSCGCGNVQCRWAIDYGVPATAAKFKADDAAARFVVEVGKLAKDKEVVPVWTTECEERDLAPDKQKHRDWSTGLCGGVECFNHQCPIKFAELWRALHATHRGPTGILALHKEFERDRKEYGAAANWIVNVVESLDQQKPAPVPRKQLWLVIQGYDASAEEELAARQAARRTEPGAVLVARTRIDQSYEPRIVSAK